MTTVSQADSTTATQTDHTVVEWASFRLADGASEAQLIAASDRVHEDVLRHEPGFIRRELLRGDNGQWADLVFWADIATNERIMRMAASHPAFAAYFACMHGAQMQVTRRVRVY